ncbi:hypothetical protein HDF15_000077 [Granulicella mallensis]|uniref:Uncharacterized protein n=1 Tax=Granulicella mallensis TaxID=940614 RepID=A0A7W7ZL59_9BACT|nr:hypothetical protein [Granulicella mallensis]
MRQPFVVDLSKVPTYAVVFGHYGGPFLFGSR